MDANFIQAMEELKKQGKSFAEIKQIIMQQADNMEAAEKKRQEEEKKRQEEEKKRKEEEKKRKEEKRRGEEEKRRGEEEEKKRKEEEKKRQEEEERRKKEDEEKRKNADSLTAKIKAYISANVPVYLAGPAGCGKSYSVRKAAQELGLDFYMDSQIQTSFETKGYTDATGQYVETEFFRAFTRGGVYLLDEMDSCNPDALVALNNAIANKYFTFPGNIGRVEAHPNFRVVAAGNTCGEGANETYTGRQRLDAATLNRYVFLQCNYRNDIQEQIGGRELSDFINNLRKAFATIGKQKIISYRQIEYISRAEKTNILPLDEILYDALFSTENEDDFNAVIFQLENASNNKYSHTAHNIDFKKFAV